MASHKLRNFSLLLGLIGVMMLPSLAQAQLTFDVYRVTCADFLAMPRSQSRVFAAWISGYFSQKKGRTWIDFEVHSTNIDKVKRWCAAHPKEIVMDALERKVTNPK